MAGFPEGFEWDEEKARTNWTKHGISFRTAVHVFDDPYRIEGKFIMGKTIYYKLEPGTPLTEEEIQELDALENRPVVPDEDAPELTGETLRGLMEARRKKPYRGPVPDDLKSKTVTLTISAATFNKARKVSANPISFLSGLLDKAVAEYTT